MIITIELFEHQSNFADAFREDQTSRDPGEAQAEGLYQAKDRVLRRKPSGCTPHGVVFELF